MTKMIKLSLVAAVAVAGFTTSAAAADLSATTFSGKMEVEYDYSKNKIANTTANAYDLDLDVTARTKLSDTWTSVVTVQADNAPDIRKGGANTNASTQNKSNVDVVATYFQYANGTTTVKIGRQGGLNATPYFDDERGDGALVLHTIGSVTLAAAHFDNINHAYNTEATNAVGVIGSFGPVNASLWYADVSNTFDAMTLNVNGKFGIVTVGLTHTELDAGLSKDNALTKLIVSAPVGPVTLTAGYGMTDKKGGLVAFNDDASASFTLDNVSMNGVADADAFLLGVSGTFGDVTASLTHLNGKAGTDDFDETQVKVAYPLAKALKVTASYSDYEIETVKEGASASIALEYKF